MRLLMIGTLLSACVAGGTKTDDDGGGGGGPPASVGELCAGLETAFCGAAAVCCDRPTFSDAGCRDSTSARCLMVAQGVSSGAATYDPALGAACLEGVAALQPSCPDESYDFLPWYTHVAACRSMITGTLAEGQSCPPLTISCQPGLECVSSALPPANGVCVRPPAIGESCDSPGECADGAYCDMSTNRCAAQTPVGSSCTSSSCVGTAYCDTGRICRARKEAGATCNRAEECLSGTCNGTCGTAQSSWCVGQSGGSCNSSTCSNGCCAGDSCESGTSVTACQDQFGGSSCVDCTAAVQHATGVACGGGGCTYGGCQPGYDNCDFRADNGCEADLDLDPNCGACGTECAYFVQNATGAACNAGSCDYAACDDGFADCDGDRANGCEEPGTCPLARQQGGPQMLVSDGAALFWVTLGGGTVATVPTGGGTAVDLATFQDTPEGLAVDATHVYWAARGDGNVMRVPKGGGSPELVAGVQNNPSSVAVDANNVYWTNWGGGTVMQKPKAGGSAVEIAHSQSFANAISVDGTHVYWTSMSGVVRTTIGAATSTGQLIAPKSSVRALALAGGYAYYASDDGSVERAPVDGSAQPTGIGSGIGGAPRAILVDGATVYVTDLFGNTVWSLPAAGGSTVAFASDQNGPWGLAADGTYIYWTNTFGGTVRRQAK